MKKIILIFCLLLCYNVNASNYTHVYCADESKNWNWLSDIFGNKYIVYGDWEFQYLKNNYYIHYFNITGGKKIVEKLKRRCIEKFGETYKIAQPAFSSATGWRPFGVKNDFIFKGFFTVFQLSYFIFKQNVQKKIDLSVNNKFFQKDHITFDELNDFIKIID